jgi:hypothetical protein
MIHLLEGQADLVRFQGRQLQSGYENKERDSIRLALLREAFASPLFALNLLFRLS